MHKSRRIRTSRSRLSVALLAAMVVPWVAMGDALAQEPQEAPETQADAQGQASQLDTVTVTGSRIRRAGFDTLEPTKVITAEQYLDAGLTNVADMLRRTPSFGAGVTPDGAQSSFGAGVNFANRFNLGTNRTLTVVNGRRFVSSNTTTIFGPAAPGLQVDLNVIPTALIERVENLAIGGAPTYGSDAIAGTINVILKKDYEGTAFNIGYGATERGDNHRLNYSSLFGVNFGEGRGNFNAAMSYDKVDGVLQTERDFYRSAHFFTTNPGGGVLGAWPGRTPGNDGRYFGDIPFNTTGADGIPNAILIRDRRIYSTPPGGLLYFGFVPGSGNTRLAGPNGSNTTLAFDRNGNLVSYDQGYGFTAVDASGGDGLNLVEMGQITADLERKTLSLNARWGLTDFVDVFFEGTRYQADAHELAAQSIYNSPLFGGLSSFLTIPASHPLLTQQARDTLAEHGLTSFNLSRASRDLVTNNSRNNNTISRGVFGFNGSFDLGNRAYYWEASANHGRTANTFTQTVLNQQNFINAMNATVDGSGRVVCAGTPIPGLFIPGGNTPVADPRCVPLDLFGDGRPSQAARDYVTDMTRAKSTIEQRVYNINLSSTLLDLWSGPLQYNVGYERRREAGRFSPDEFQMEGRGRAVPIEATGGEFTTDEFFGEVLIPLVSPSSDIPFLKKLDLTGKYRQVDNTINGKFDTYTYGLQWKPFDDFEIRGNFTRSLRAPAITELFAPLASAFRFTNDPCDSRLIGAGTRREVRARNCAAFLEHYGLTSFTSNAMSASVMGTTGGNRTLQNESADSYTYGFTWSPSFARGLIVAADYYNIKIKDAIFALDNDDIAIGCFDNDDFNAGNVPNANAYCGLLVRNDSGQIVDWVSTYINTAFLNLESYSAEVRYDFATERYGRFSVGASGYFPRTLTRSPVGIVQTDTVGTVGDPERQYQAFVNWKRNRWGVGLNANYWSSTATLLGSAVATPEDRDILGLGSHVLFNANASVQLSKGVMARLAVTNLMDKDPPFPSVVQYDNLGRRYFMSLEWNF
ncbi:MAG: TonB-dependent receptor [Luteimonas sp.]|nr:TonB-dependent receptor [Luteimonas sp.]